MRHRPLATLLCLLALGAGSAHALPPPEDCAATYPGVNARIDRAGRLLIAGQPDEATLRALAAEGVRVVINLRTPAEMDNRERVPFDEAQVLAELGVTYVHIPVNNSPEFPWRPEIADAIRDALAATDGTVLLHCQSGMRTAWAYAGYCIHEHDMPLQEAIDLVGTLQDDPSGDPICPLLGIEATFVYADETDRDADAGAANAALAPAPSECLVAPTGLHALAIQPPEVITDFPADVTRVTARVGPLYIAGQPSEAALRHMKDDGVSVVINLRTPHEMENREWVPFDEAALLAELGIDYVHLPLGGPDEHPWSPEAVDAFAAALASHEGKALLHCTVAWRASLMWAAYLVRHRGMDLNEAVAQAGTIYPLSWPLEKLVGRTIHLRIVE